MSKEKSSKPESVLFRKKSLSERVADSLRASILSGTWTSHLPTERSLCLKVEASRPVLRRALHILADEGLVRITAGHPTRIVAHTIEKRSSAKRRHVVLLIGLSLESFGKLQMVFMDEVRHRLQSMGYSFEVVVDRRLPQKRVGHFLKELVQQHDADHWILSSMPQSVQSWFQNEGLPAVIDGSSFPLIHLPSADFDHRAIARHAAGILLGLGHRRIASFIRSREAAGDRAMEEGFLEAFEKHQDVFPRVILHSDDMNVIRSKLKNALTPKTRPTAIVVSNAMDFIVVMTSLLEWGFRIPKDISLIAQHPETFMDRLTPSPARYDIDSVKQAQAVCRLIQNPSYHDGIIRQIPRFHRGGTLAAPPS